MPAYKDEKRGTWFAQFYFTDWQGKKRKTTKRGFDKKKDAQEYEREFLAKTSFSCDMSFESLADLYFEDMEKRLKASTIESKKHIFRTKLIPTFGKLPISEISPPQIRKWQTEMMSQGLAETYLKTINNQLSAVFNYAVRYYNLPNNPVRIVGSMGKKKADSMDFWTLEEFKQFIAVVDKPAMKLAFQVMFWTGLRIGETLALFPKATPHKQ